MNLDFGYQTYQFFFDLLSFALLLPCYYALGPQGRRLLMIFGGIYLVYFIAPRLAFFYLIFWSLVFFIHRFAFIENMPATPEQRRKKWLRLLGLIGLPLLVLPLILWKMMETKFVVAFSVYNNDLLALLSSKVWQIDLCKPAMAPIGLSFATFRAIDLLVKTSLGKISDLSFDRVLFYGFFPPVQVVGPIIEYEEIADQATKPDPQNILEGLLRIGLGFVKAFLLAGLLENNAKIFQHPADYQPWALWLRLSGYTWYFYLNFSGYSDIAIGTARLFGFVLKENFNYPYFRPNIQEFWHNWHMSLSRWAQRNVFVPCGGYRQRTQYTALFMTMLAIAMWHNINVSMVVFAIVQFGALMLHRLRAPQAASLGLSVRPAPPEGYKSAAEPQRAPGRLRTASYILLTYLTIMLCFPLIVLQFKKALSFYGFLLGVG